MIIIKQLKVAIFIGILALCLSVFSLHRFFSSPKVLGLFSSIGESISSFNDWAFVGFKGGKRTPPSTASSAASGPSSNKSPFQKPENKAKEPKSPVVPPIGNTKEKGTEDKKNSKEKDSEGNESKSTKKKNKFFGIFKSKKWINKYKNKLLYLWLVKYFRRRFGLAKWIPTNRIGLQS